MTEFRKKLCQQIYNSEVKMQAVVHAHVYKFIDLSSSQHNLSNIYLQPYLNHVAIILKLRGILCPLKLYVKQCRYRTLY